MLYENQTENGLRCIKSIRNRFDGLKRNPFDEPECGHHYARSMASWAAVLAYSGFNYSAVEKSMEFTANAGTYFWSNGSAWGTCKIGGNKAELTVLKGEIQLRSFTLKGHSTKKLKNVNVLESSTITIQL